MAPRVDTLRIHIRRPFTGPTRAPVRRGTKSVIPWEFDLLRTGRSNPVWQDPSLNARDAGVTRQRQQGPLRTSPGHGEHSCEPGKLAQHAPRRRRREPPFSPAGKPHGLTRSSNGINRPEWACTRIETPVALGGGMQEMRARDQPLFLPEANVGNRPCIHLRDPHLDHRVSPALWQSPTGESPPFQPARPPPVRLPLESAPLLCHDARNHSCADRPPAVARIVSQATREGCPA